MAESNARSDEEVLAVPVQDILRQIDHIEQNGISLKKFGGENVDEGRCRELCAMYLREFIQAEAMGKRLMKMPGFAPVSEQQPSVAVADMEIIGHREPGDAHKGRAWWSGGTWLQPGEVVAVLTLPKQDERNER